MSALALLILSALLTWPQSSTAAQSAVVVKVVDGDTVVVKVAGHRRTIDLLGVKAPSSGTCFSAQSRAKLKALLRRGARIRVARDTNRGGRGRYVTKGGNLVNASMLRAGAARASRLSGLSRASTLRSASRSAQDAGRGLFGACTAPAPAPTPVPPTPAAPGPIENANAIRAALVGRQLVEFFSTARSSTRNTTTFCSGGRADRAESFTGEIGHVEDQFSGSWAVFAASREADGSLMGEIHFSPDSGADARVFVVSVATDGTVRRTDAKASELNAGGACSPAQPSAGLENDTTSAHDQVRQTLVGKRVADGAGTLDFCSATRAIRREVATVVDGSWVVEWAGVDTGGYAGVIALKGTSTSRRFVLAGASQSPPSQLRDLSSLSAQAQTVTTAGAAC